MAQTSGFFNSHLDSQGNFDRVYLAEQFASYFSNFIGNGVFAHLLDKFVVTAGTGLSVNVGTGKAFVKGFWFESDAQETLSIDLPDGLLNRKDNIVIRFDFENRVTGIYVVKGVAATTPSAPEVVRNSLVFELKIAEIFVGASISAISQSAITDTRSNNNVCGWVTGLVNQVDTSDLFLQYSQAYQEAIEQMQNDEQSMMSQMNAWFANQRTAFDAWMSTLTEELNVDGYMVCHEFRFMKEDDEWPNNMAFIISSSYYDWANEFDLTKKFDKIEVFVNGLLLPDYDDYFSNFKHTYGSDIPDFPVGSKHYVVKVTHNTVGRFNIQYGYVNNANNNIFYPVNGFNLRENEVIVRLYQFRKGIRS